MTMQCCLNIAETGNQSQAKCNLFMSAMKELAAFFTAIDNLFGTEQARRSALNWIEELESIDWQIEDSMPNWRQATEAASALLSASHCRKVSRPNYEALENWSNGGKNVMVTKTDVGKVGETHTTFPPEIKAAIPR